MNKTHLNIAKKKREQGWTYANIAAYLQKKGARTREGKDLYGAYVINELNSSEMKRSRLDDRIAQKEQLFEIIKNCKANNTALTWIDITARVNLLGYRNMHGKAFLTASLKGIYKEANDAQDAKKKTEK